MDAAVRPWLPDGWHLHICKIDPSERRRHCWEIHGSGYSSWRAEKLPSGLMDPTLGFADLEPRRTAPQAPSQSESGPTSTALASSAGPNLYAIVCNQLL